MRQFRFLWAILTLLILTLWFIPTTGAHKARASNPTIAVLQFSNKADNQWWFHGGAAAAQDAFVSELNKTGKFQVLDRQKVDALMQARGLTISGDLNAATAVRLGKLLGARYLLTGAVTEYGAVAAGAKSGVFDVRQRKFVAALKAQLIDTSTGKSVWSDAESSETSDASVSVGGFGGGVAQDNRMFDQVMKPTIQKLVARLKAARP